LARDVEYDACALRNHSTRPVVISPRVVIERRVHVEPEVLALAMSRPLGQIAKLQIREPEVSQLTE